MDEQDPFISFVLFLTVFIIIFWIFICAPVATRAETMSDIETGKARIHPEEAQRRGEISWDLREVKYRGIERTWSNAKHGKAHKVWDVDADEEHEPPLAEDIYIVDTEPDEVPEPPSRDQL